MEIKWIEENGTKWAADDRGNKCSVRYFGDEEKAEKALRSLIDCDNCINCSYCSYCSYCSDCSYCSYCSDCRSCSDCSDCSDCSYCSSCRSCSYCSSCSSCRSCSYCSDCSSCEKVTFTKDKKGDFVPPVIPEIENIHKKIYEAVSHPDALEMDNVHTCNTTHCRAGWVVHLCGEEGYALERYHGWDLAAQLIYRESGYQINPCRFYDSNEEALEDMKKLAEAAV